MSSVHPKLILHSDQSVKLTSELDKEILLSMTGKRRPKITYIPSVPDPYRRYFLKKLEYYTKIGFPDVVYFDPEESCSQRDIESVFSADVVHLSGGEVTSFCNRLRFTQCDRHLQTFAARGGVILGVSAGAMLLGKTFQSASLFGERGCFEGLGFFDFEIVPHASEMFPRLDLLEKFARTHNKPVYVLNDGDVVLITGKKIKTRGNVVVLG